MLLKLFYIHFTWTVLYSSLEENNTNFVIPTSIIAGSIVAGILLLSLFIFIIVIVICCYKIKSEEKKKQYAHMLMELKEVKMEDKYKKESHDNEFTDIGMTRHVCLYVLYVTCIILLCSCECLPGSITR